MLLPKSNIPIFNLSLILFLLRDPKNKLFGFKSRCKYPDLCNISKLDITSMPIFNVENRSNFPSHIDNKRSKEGPVRLSII